MLVNGEPVEKQNVNVKRLIKERNNVNNVNVRVNSNNSREYDKAKYLVEKFIKLGYDDAPKCFNYFVKCFRNLSEDTVWSLYEKADNNPFVTSKIKYFIGACRNQMG